MRSLIGWISVVGFAMGCTVPELEEITGDSPRACNAERPCGEGYLCIRELCVKATCEEGVPVVGYRDGDGDGFAPLEAGYELFCGSAPGGYASQVGDCNDGDRNIHPGAQEACDGLDNDCRNGIDDGLPLSSLSDFFLDADGDLVGAGSAVRACAAPPRHVSSGGDCDDGNAARAPGKPEVCDELDNDCNTAVDDGLATSAYHRDADGDLFGVESEVVEKCRAPAGYVPATTVFDCNDTRADVKPGAVELCNDIDDNCVSGADEPFDLKGATCSNDICAGKYLCNAAQTGVECTATAPTRYYPDFDKDGEGSMSAADLVKVCAPDAPPAGYLTNSTDCDDRDSHNKSAGVEVCDDRDNNCDNSKDEGSVCNGKGWKELTIPVLSISRSWNTVALGVGGYPVWIAGDTGALAVRMAAGENFTEVPTSKCGTTSWNASWVRPSDGQVFLAGDRGTLAAYNAASTLCTVSSTEFAPTSPSTRPLLGITGFESAGVTTVYVVNDLGTVYSWSPGAVPGFKVKRASNDAFRDIQGTLATRLFIVGDNGLGPEVDSYDGVTAGSALLPQTIQDVPGANVGPLHGVALVGSSQAFAVGQKGLLLKWGAGTSSWNFASPNATMQADLTSVVAFDDFAVYVADATGRIRRPRSTDWLVHYTTTGGVALEDIAASSKGDIWAVGNGRVVHFPE